MGVSESKRKKQSDETIKKTISSAIEGTWEDF